jgi:DNA-binding beta-propeller fold protein YncE
MKHCIIGKSRKESNGMKTKVILSVVVMLSLLSVLVTPVACTPAMAVPHYSLKVFATGLNGPFGMAFDKDGNLYVANEGKGGGGGNTISKITLDGEVSIYATGFGGPSGLAFDDKGNLWVSDDQHLINIWKIAPDGSITGYDFGFQNPNAIAFDKDWNLFVSDAGSGCIYKISPDGTVSIFAGPFGGPQAVAFDKSGNVYTSDFTGRIYKIDPHTGLVNVFSEGILKSTNGGLAFDKKGNLYASECWGEGVQNVYVFTPDGEGKPFVTGFEPTDFNFPRGLVFDKRGRLYITEYGRGIIWRVAHGLALGKEL